MARPVQGGSTGTWGTELDAYLDLFVDSTGALVPAAVRTALGGSIPVNVMDYGAIGDGSTDDVAALNLALAAVPAGGALIFPPNKTYALGSEWNPSPTTGITVVAYGATFKPIAAASGRIKVGSTSAYVNDFKWFGGKYVGTGGSNFVFAMSAFLGTGCHVEDYGFSGLPANASAEGIIVSGDGRLVTDAATTAGSTTVTSATAAFTSADVGKVVIIWGAGTGGYAFESRITAFTNSTTVTVATPVWLAVSGARMNIATMQNAVFRGIRGIDAGGDSFRVNQGACGVKLEDAFFQNSSAAGATKGGVMCNGAPFVVTENVGVDGCGGYGIRLLGYKNKAIVPRVRNWPSSNDGIRMCEEGVEVIAPEVSDSKDGSGSGYGIRLTNDSGLSTAPIGMKVKGGNVRGCGGVKIDFVGPNGAAPLRCEVDTTIEGCSQDGVLVTHGKFHRIRGIVCNNARDGVHVDNATDLDIEVTAFDTQASKTQVYAVRSTGTADRLKVRGKLRAADHLTGSLSLVGTNNDLGYSQTELAAIGKGLITEPFNICGTPGAVAAPGATGTSSTLVATLNGVHEGQTITNIVVFCGATGSVVTLVKLGVLDTAGNVLAVTGDVKASLAANDYLVGALGTPYVVTGETEVYLALLALAGTTVPTFFRGASATGLGKRVAGTGLRTFANVAAQDGTTFAVSGALTLADANTGFWIAAS